MENFAADLVIIGPFRIRDNLADFAGVMGRIESEESPIVVRTPGGS